ncbi:MAG: hypothetical protein ABIL06_18790 [Pseudomonadota bacterium]
MSSDQINPKPEKKGASDSSFFTVMISKGLGKVRSFNISSRLLIWSSVIFALYLIISVVVMNLYVDEFKAKNVQMDLLQQLQDQIEDTKSALFRAKQRLRFLEDYICKSQGNQRKEAEAPQPEVPDPVPSIPVAREKTQKKSEKEKPIESVLNIEKLTTSQAGERLSVKFRLVKVKPDIKEEVSGYIFIIASNNKSGTLQSWPHPKAALKDDVPVNYKQGQVFKVRNYRIIRGNFFIDSETERPSFLKILAYDTSGKLILKKVFAIEKPQ